MNAPIPPGFIQQADAVLERMTVLDLDNVERRALERLQREKHDLLLKEGKFLRELTAWAEMVEKDVAYRKAREESIAANAAYRQTMQELEAFPAVTVTEYVAAEPAEHPAEEAA